MQARQIKSVTGAPHRASGRFAIQITDAAGQSLAVAMGPKEAAKFVGYILKLATDASTPTLQPGTAEQMPALHPVDFGHGAGQTASESNFFFQIGPLRFALSLPTAKWLEMCRDVVARAPSADGRGKYLQ